MEQQQLSSPLSETPVASLSESNEGEPPTKKRKAPHEYSTNPNTVRVRQRNASLTPYRRAVERAKSNDLKAVTAGWRERVNTESYKEASESEKQKILEEVEKEIMSRRREKKIDADSKIAALNEQYMPGEKVPTPPSGDLANAAAAKAVPQLAPPGYVPFPAQVIPDLMVSSKDTPPQHVNPTGLASTSPAPRVEGKPVRPTSAIPADPVTSHDNSQIMAAIEDLKEQYKTERRQREEEIRRLDEGIREIHSMIETVMQQLTVLLQARHLPTSYYTPHHSVPHPTYTPTLTLPDTPSPVQPHNPGYGDGCHEENNGYNYTSGTDGLW